MKYFVLAGESSGDMHASNLIHFIKKYDSNADIVGWGGEKMERENCKILKHYKDLAFMGFTEVLKHLPQILKNFSTCKSQISSFKPDVVILVDFPGFNLRMAKWLKENSYKVIYYISPQVWAWKESRVASIKKYVDKMYVILPFEKKFYAERNLEVEYNGHPLIDEINKYQRKTDESKEDDKVIAILPGSRKQEILKILPLMLKVCKYYPHLKFVVSAVPHIDLGLYTSFVTEKNISIQIGDVYSLLNKSYAAIVTSGTATLETALFKVPEVVCFKGSAISYWLAKRLIKVKFISLVNLILDEKAIDELIQNDLNEENLRKAFEKLLNKEGREVIYEKYKCLISKLGVEGSSEKSAQSIVNYIYCS